jgi:hypothetical protein
MTTFLIGLGLGPFNWVLIGCLDQKNPILQSGSMAELAKASAVHASVLGLNLSSDRKQFLILFVSHLNPNIQHYLYIDQ